MFRLLIALLLLSTPSWAVMRPDQAFEATGQRSHLTQPALSTRLDQILALVADSELATPLYRERESFEESIAAACYDLILSTKRLEDQRFIYQTCFRQTEDVEPVDRLIKAHHIAVESHIYELIGGKRDIVHYGEVVSVIAGSFNHIMSMEWLRRVNSADPRKVTAYSSAKDWFDDFFTQYAELTTKLTPGKSKSAYHQARLKIGHLDTQRGATTVDTAALKEIIWALIPEKPSFEDLRLAKEQFDSIGFQLMKSPKSDCNVMFIQQ